MRRLISLVVLAALATLASRATLPGFSDLAGQSTWSLGFLLLAAFTLGELLAVVRLPRITGYLLAGLVFGPYMLGIVSKQSVESLTVINSLALTFIALSAGGELRLDELREYRRSILWSILGQMTIIFAGTFLLVLAVSPLFEFTRSMEFKTLAVMAALMGAIATARSPASAIALIKETRARGPFTEVVLAVTVALDILTIVLFALVVSVGQSVLTGAALDFGFIVGLGLEILISLTLGVGLGFALAAWLRRVEGYHLITLFIVAVMVAQSSKALNQLLEARFHLSFHLEPMLICIATGFVVRNFSRQGKRFMEAIERGGLLIYTVFFALAGATLDLNVLRQGWALALVLVAVRAATVQTGSWAGMRLAKAPKSYGRLMGMTVITQAGVSLGLAMTVEQRFPGWGALAATLLVATISINQLVGPVLFKHALWLAGETGEQRESSS